MVQVGQPFYWPTAHHGHHDSHDDEADIRVMEEVMGIMKNVLAPPAPPAAPADATRALLTPARLAFRDALLGVSLPEVVAPAG
jgi:hypothetical protein